jgi:hypothetical protein
MRGDIEGALALHKEQERLCRELGSQEALSIALACEANILRRIAERRVEAKQLVEEALQIATSHGYQHNIPLYEHIRDAIAAEENKSRILWDGYNPTPHPSTDGARAAQLNIEYQRALKNWQALPWLKRMRTRKPTPPTGI